MVRGLERGRTKKTSERVVRRKTDESGFWTTIRTEKQRILGGGSRTVEVEVL